MKITFLLSAIIVFTGCTAKRGQPQPNSGKPGAVGTPVNSPIIISDGSTHIRHKGMSNGDFHIVNDSGAPHIVVDDSGYSATTLECVMGVACPNNAAITLVGGWTMDIFALDSEDSNTTIKILTIKSADNSRIVLAFHRNPIDPEYDAMLGGTDIIENNLTFKSATLTNGGATIQFSCPTATTTPSCEIRINYVHP